MTINPTIDLDDIRTKNYTVNVEFGAIRDSWYNNYSGIEDGSTTMFAQTEPYAQVGNETTFMFGVPDVTAPFIVARYPANGARNLPEQANMTIEFSEEVQKGEGIFVLTTRNSSADVYGWQHKSRAASGNRTVINVTSDYVRVTGKLVTIDLPHNMTSGVDYTLEYPSNIVKDLATVRTSPNPAPVVEYSDYSFIIRSRIDIIFDGFGGNLSAAQGKIVFTSETGELTAIPMHDTSQVTVQTDQIIIRPILLDQKRQQEYTIYIGEGAVSDPTQGSIAALVLTCMADSETFRAQYRVH